MSSTKSMAKFSLGQLVISQQVSGLLTTDDVLTALGRHMDGDWGEVSEEYWRSNDEALELGSRLISKYFAAGGTAFLIITEWDRSRTAILLPPAKAAE